MAERVRVSARYRITVPSAVRKRLGIEPGDHLLVEARDGYAILMPEPAEYAAHLRGLHAEVWRGEDAARYVDRERDAWRD